MIIEMLGLLIYLSIGFYIALNNYFRENTDIQKLFLVLFWLPFALGGTLSIIEDYVKKKKSDRKNDKKKVRRND